MTDAQTREAVKNLYPKSKSWARRVDHMPMRQVIAIYLNMQQQASSVPPKTTKEQEGNETPF